MASDFDASLLILEDRQIRIDLSRSLTRLAFPPFQRPLRLRAKTRSSQRVHQV